MTLLVVSTLIRHHVWWGGGGRGEGGCLLGYALVNTHHKVKVRGHLADDLIHLYTQQPAPNIGNVEMFC